MFEWFLLNAKESVQFGVDCMHETRATRNFTEIVMKRCLIGLVLVVSMMLAPALASASPMDGTYVGAGSANAGFFSFVFDPYNLDIGANPTLISVDVTGATLPSADVLAFGPIFPIEGVKVELASDSVISFESTLPEFTGAGTLSFFDLDPVFGFMTAIFDASGFTNYFGEGTSTPAFASGTFAKQTATPIPGAIWLLGTGLVGLVGFRRKKHNA